MEGFECTCLCGNFYPSGHVPLVRSRSPRSEGGAMSVPRGLGGRESPGEVMVSWQSACVTLYGTSSSLMGFSDAFPRSRGINDVVESSPAFVCHVL